MFSECWYNLIFHVHWDCGFFPSQFSSSFLWFCLSLNDRRNFIFFFKIFFNSFEREIESLGWWGEAERGRRMSRLLLSVEPLGGLDATTLMS